MRETVSIDINDFVIMHKWNSKENYSILHVTIALKINEVFMNQIYQMNVTFYRRPFTETCT